ncbi:zincin-like metallopeptidase domain-containing protein [Nitrosomonas sp.]|uniref:zincin-like metallopeptidase domain-containing protein n=1 Tax=Nitrosomonas sp. TaxID=42353 RepID=UPI0025F302D1|nr:zincin-like metallopeptidase domain-containing protein [Nitrosomonas sp.]
MKNLFLILLSLTLATACQTQNNKTMKPASLPNGYWSLEKSQPLIDETQTIHLTTNLSELSTGERIAIEKLLLAGNIFQRLYEKQRHPQAQSSHHILVQLDKANSSQATQNLLNLYRLYRGPIATTLENKRESFLPVDPIQPGMNLYPWKITKELIEAAVKEDATGQLREEVLDLRTVVRRVEIQDIRADIATLRKYPALKTLHPNLLGKLQALETKQGTGGIYTVPYAVAYADDLFTANQLLNEAADAINKDDWEFARYLRNKARDLLTNDYESGDASWVTGHFKNINAEIGSYETYNDELYGVKTFFAFSLLLTRQAETAALRQAIKGLQSLEDSLPYLNHKKIREDIPIGVYDVIADFGESRGINTATILPNESYLARRYGRTILLRANILREPNIFEDMTRKLTAAVGEEQAKELTLDGEFYNTVWHEVGHYLGVDRTKDGRDLGIAFEDNSSTLEELKADLVSLFVAKALHKQGYYTDAQLRSVYAAGILRVLLNNKPRRDQPHNTMQLMQWNFFMENDLLSFDQTTKTLHIHYDKYHDVAGKMLAKTLDVQFQGDKAVSEKFIDQYTTWDENLHGIVAANIRAQQKFRFRLLKYTTLGE